MEPLTRCPDCDGAGYLYLIANEESGLIDCPGCAGLGYRLTRRSDSRHRALSDHRHRSDSRPDT